MDSLVHTISPYFIPPPIMRERVSVVAIAIVLHLAVLMAWLLQPPSAPVPEHEMEVTVLMLAAPVVQTETPPVQPTPRTVPVRQPRVEKSEPASLPVEAVEQSSDTPAVMPTEPPPVAAAAPVIVPSAPATPDVEPDYKASYLNNRLTYPLAARRMGLQGRVVLNVEVLAEGQCGQVNVRQSSGHEILDNAAMQSVKTWKFIPARKGGYAITKWFLIPIQFSLKDSEA